MTLERRQIGELDCAVVDGPSCGQKITAVVVLCHGFGASGEDLVPCAPEIYSATKTSLRHVRFVFPAAPIKMDPTGHYDSRAWWPIDMVKLQSMMESGETRDLRKDRPELLDQQREHITELLKHVIEETGIGYDKLVLGGFSQGAMLTTEVTLALPEMVGGLIVWSGTLLSEDAWTQFAGNKAGLRVVQSHGRIDPILPYSGAELLRDLFKADQIENQFIEFVGQHTIPREAITAAAELIADVTG